MKEEYFQRQYGGFIYGMHEESQGYPQHILFYRDAVLEVPVQPGRSGYEERLGLLEDLSAGRSCHEAVENNYSSDPDSILERSDVGILYDELDGGCLEEEEQDDLKNLLESEFSFLNL